VHKLEEIKNVLFDAVMLGAAEILAVKSSGRITAGYKDATELVTAADRASDTAILAAFQSRFPAIDPEISFHLEESGFTGPPGRKRAGADPLDGTNHFACGGNLYCIQAHYVEDGVPLAGVVFQPEIYLPLNESENGESANCTGRIAFAVRGGGAFAERTEFAAGKFTRGGRRRVQRKTWPETKTYVSCVPITPKMTAEERDRVRRIQDSGIIAVTTGAGSAGANVMMTIFGGQHVYANFGAGEDLDLIPPQIIAEEAGMTVWGIERRSPVWITRKQPFVVAARPELAELFLKTAGL
jgi:3'-phosphoadenosine 5'-phosphosulfate (PAPS) 3'-phosphatase